MSHRNLPNILQRQHGNHSNDCGCMKGEHIWDTEYDGGKEKWCVCCEHFISLDDEAEEAAIEKAVVMNETASNKILLPKSEKKSKGVIRRSS